MHFVRAQNTHLTLNGQPFRIAAANNYYLGHASPTMVEAVFAQAIHFGLNVLRTWAFLDGGISQPDTLPPPGSQNGVFFQYWNSHTNGPGYNDGSTGLERLDYAVALAERHNLRLILTLANNWPDFGGIPQYLQWFQLTGHHRFFQHPEVNQAYRAYVRHLLTRTNTITGRTYSDEPAILAWELINEPRCVDDRGCPVRRGTETLLAWISEMSGFVKALAPRQLICAGDEGFFHHHRSGGNHLYNGHYGVDCERILKIPAIDFGTYHLYPKFQPDHDAITFGRRWIREHLEVGAQADKPMMLEEFGYPTHIPADLAHRDIVYQAWLDEVQRNNGAGAAVWMLASTTKDGRPYPDYDHHTLYSAADAPAMRAFAQASNSIQSDS